MTHILVQNIIECKFNFVHSYFENKAWFYTNWSTINEIFSWIARDQHMFLYLCSEKLYDLAQIGKYVFHNFKILVKLDNFYYLIITYNCSNWV